MDSERKQDIADMANGGWASRVPQPISDDEFDRLSREWDQKAEAFVMACRDPEEIDFFADLWNWDQGIWPFKIIADNPACELATALMIYWRAQPQEYIGIYNPNFPELSDLLEHIQQKVLEGSYPIGVCSYDPALDAGPDYATRYVPPIPIGMARKVDA